MTHCGSEAFPRECSHYYIIRFYRHGGRRIIATGLTEAEAQAHCCNPETSSSTARGAAARRITRRNGGWFDGYDCK
jgi:hypothetical protein